jgi:RimJ/RimL family protein N-acetyltransferase
MSDASPPEPLRDGPIGRVGSRVRLRELTLGDAAFVDARDADPSRTGAFNDFGLPTPAPLAEQLADGRRLVTRDRGRLLIERIDDGSILGDVSWRPATFGADERSRAFEFGVSLEPAARGHGHGTEAQRLLAELLFDLYTLERVQASTDIDNIAEQRSLEKAGFTREGVLRRAQFRAGDHHDLVQYSLVRGDLDLTPPATAPQAARSGAGSRRSRSGPRRATARRRRERA